MAKQRKKAKAAPGREKLGRFLTLLRFEIRDITAGGLPRRENRAALVTLKLKIQMAAAIAGYLRGDFSSLDEAFGVTRGPGNPLRADYLEIACQLEPLTRERSDGRKGLSVRKALDQLMAKGIDLCDERTAQRALKERRLDAIAAEIAAEVLKSDNN